MILTNFNRECHWVIMDEDYNPCAIVVIPDGRFDAEPILKLAMSEELDLSEDSISLSLAYEHVSSYDGQFDFSVKVIENGAVYSFSAKRCARYV